MNPVQSRPKRLLDSENNHLICNSFKKHTKTPSNTLLINIYAKIYLNKNFKIYKLLKNLNSPHRQKDIFTKADLKELFQKFALHIPPPFSYTYKHGTTSKLEIVVFNNITQDPPAIPHAPTSSSKTYRSTRISIPPPFIPKSFQHSRVIINF